MDTCHMLPPLAALIVIGCRDAAAPSAPESEWMPDLQVVATAYSVDAAGTTVDCRVLIQIDLEPGGSREGGVVTYTGRIGGEARRSVLDRHGDGIGLMADLGGWTVVRLVGHDSVEIGAPPPDDVVERFWRELAFIAGSRRGDDIHTLSGSGLWTCRPFDIPEGGWADTTHDAPGTWTLGPVANDGALAPIAMRRILRMKASPPEGLTDPAMIRISQLTSKIRRVGPRAPIARMLLGAVRPGAWIFRDRGGRDVRGRAP